MSRHDSIDEALFNELFPLVDKCLDGTATDDERQQLELLVVSDPSARQLYLRLIREARFLHMWAEHDPAGAPTTSDTLDISTPQTSRGFVPSTVRNVLDWRHHPVQFGTFALALTLVIWVAFIWSFLPSLRNRDIADENQVATAVAYFSGGDDAVWDDTTQLKMLGRGESKYEGPYYQGDQLHLKSGLIQLTFATGAIVVIEGPAEFSVGGNAERGTRNAEPSADPSSEFPAPTSNSGFLRRGQLVARCQTTASKGFAIVTPHARVVDQGTEFGVDVDNAGAAQVVVLSGAVDLISQPAGGGAGRRVRLTKDEGASVAAVSGTITRSSEVDIQLVATMRSRLQNVGPGAPDTTDRLVAYWPLNDGTPGSEVAGADDVIDDRHHPATDATAVGSGGTWVEDPTRGIVLSTTGSDHLDAGTQGIAGDFTWSLWIKTTELSGRVVMGNRSGSDPWNKLMTSGLNNWAIITPAGGDWGVADDAWHHMAVRQSGSTVSVYIDGTQTGPTVTAVGRFNGPLRIGGDAQFGERVTALISDVAIWNKALTETRIQALVAGDPVILATEDSAAEGQAALQDNEPDNQNLEP